MAQQEVIANLKGVDEEIRKLQRSAKQAANAVKDISVNLQFDSKNVELISQRFTALREELQVNQNNLATFNERLDKNSTNLSVHCLPNKESKQTKFAVQSKSTKRRLMILQEESIT